MNWNLQLQGYEQIPKLERDRFEYEVLTNLTLRRGKIKQLIINGCLVTKLNLELVRNGKKFHRQEKLANLLIGTLSLLSMLFLMALSFDLIVYTFPSRSYVIIAGDCHLRR